MSLVFWVRVVAEPFSLDDKNMMVISAASIARSLLLGGVTFGSFCRAAANRRSSRPTTPGIHGQTYMRLDSCE
jgi:hypothetical protein